MLDIVGLSEWRTHLPSEISGGQQQRVAIARALVNEPELVLADEPTGNLDSRNSGELMGVFQSLNDQGITIVLVTHDPGVARYAKRNVVIRDGRVTGDEPTAPFSPRAEEPDALRRPAMVKAAG